MGLWINGQEVYAGTLRISNDGTTTTILGRTGDYIRIGDAGTTGHTLNSEDDLLVTGELEVDGAAYFDAGITADGATSSIGALTMTGTTTVSATLGIRMNDDVPFRVGSGGDVYLIYETADADAKILLITMDESDDSGNNVPVLAFGEETNVLNVNLGLFDAIVEPIIAAIDLDADSYAYIGHSADDVPRIGTNGTGAAGIILTNPKNAVASALSGTQLDVEIDIGGTPYHFTVYPTKA